LVQLLLKDGWKVFSGKENTIMGETSKDPQEDKKKAPEPSKDETVRLKPAAPTPEKRRHVRKVMAKHRTGPAEDDYFADLDEELEETDGPELGHTAVRAIKLSHQADKYQKWLRKRYLLGIGLVLLLIVSASVYALIKHNQEQYLAKVQTTRTLMRSGVNECVELCNEYLVVWKTAIDSGEDADLALLARHGELVENADILRLDSRKSLIEGALRSISDPPFAYDKAHARLLKLFETYVELYSLAKFPSGTRESYEKTVRDLNDGFMDTAQELNAMLPK
jgi:hypothetical protein